MLLLRGRDGIVIVVGREVLRARGRACLCGFPVLFVVAVSVEVWNWRVVRFPAVVLVSNSTLWVV